MKKVFLGGTCNGSTWRDELIPMLKIDYFNPVVDDWNDEARTREIEERAKCDFVLYVITPEMKGVFAIAEAVQDSNRRPGKTVFCWLKEYGGQKFDEEQLNSIGAVGSLIINNGALAFHTLIQAAQYLNKHYVEIEYNPNVVECLIERDGPTIITLSRNTYKFEKNEAGHPVCLVMLKEHRDYLEGLGDYRIYMKHKLKKPEFTDEERDFMQEWERKGSDMFLAYVNGRIDRFNKSRGKVRAIAIEKWKSVLPKMECPIRQPPKMDSRELVFDNENFGVVTVKTYKGEEEFVKEWLPLSANDFKEYVLTTGGQFHGRPEKLLTKAKNKWDKLIFSKTGEPWPLEAT